jgi:transposase
VVTEEQTQGTRSTDTVIASPAPSTTAERAFIPLQVERSAAITAQTITIELRRGATIVKVDWPLLAAADCAAWLRELLR